MAIPTIEYRGYTLSAYPHQEFPQYHDPYAKGPRRFSCIVKVSPLPSARSKAARYPTLFGPISPTSEDDAVALAIQYGKDIIDGKVQPTEL